MINRNAIYPVCAVIVLVFCSLGLTGCTNVGPIGEPTFEKTIRNSVDLGSEPILQAGRIEWYPGEDKYNFNSFSLSSDIRPGILVLQESSLLVLGWKPEELKYQVLLKINYSEAKDVRRRVWGASQRIVVELNDGRTHAFSFTTDNGQGISVSRINTAIAILRKRIASSDAHLDQDVIDK
ncbi:MAG: hypothetical protein PHY54_18440 [Methylococcales bacterium]|nr:hypothetical protein [Methylococcales bacterium]